MLRCAVLAAFLLVPGLVAAGEGQPAPAPLAAGRLPLNDGWRFFKGDAPGAERRDFDDRGWRQLDIPHDWAIEGPFAEKNGPTMGGLPFSGTGWYRKRFVAPSRGTGPTRVWVEFDGAMANSTVWVNGHELGGRPYGYSSFGFDLTPHLVPGDNVLAVRLKPEPDSSRWYPGAGLYRHVWLDVSAPVHVARWSTFVVTPRVSAEEADVEVATAIENATAADAPVDVTVALAGPDGREVARAGPERLSIRARGRLDLTRTLRVARPALWDVEHPSLYRVTVTVTDPSGAIDDVSATRIGIRTLAFSATRGFELNGRRVKLRGVCLHHDLGALGAAVSRAAIARQLRIMRDMGVNAVRTSHNPPAPELLDLADEMGLLVIDEAFDMWGRTKVPNGHAKYFAEWHERDLRDLIRRDRNHPSVILWSIGNEILEQDEPAGAEIANHLKTICKDEDPTRLVTAGLNQFDNALRFGIAAAVDVVGFNYRAKNYAQVLKDHPDWIVYAAESASTVSSRGVYHLPVEKYRKHPSRQITSYDVIAPDWAYAPDPEFAAQDALPQVLGEFVWTGFDYLGEPTPYYGWNEPPDPQDWPSRSSYFGIVDLAGLPKDRYFLYQSVWTSAPMVHLLPHWNWPGREGQPVPVMAYTNAEQVELFLDGVSLGKRTKGKDLVRLPVGESVNGTGTFDSPYRLSWDVPYTPGTLRAVAYRGGREVARTEVRTAGAPARLSLAVNRDTIAADGRDLAFVTVRVEDANGVLCPEAVTTIRFTVGGGGTIAAVDNGDPATTAPFQASTRDAFNGLAVVVVRAPREAGAVEVTATADGLASATTTLQAR
jgi:beta-galactosidase